FCVLPQFTRDFLSFLFFIYYYVEHRHLPSFPTRRSSDLNILLNLNGEYVGLVERKEAMATYGLCELLRYILNKRLHLQELALRLDRKSTRLNSSHVKISYAVFCLKKKNTTERLIQHWSKS